MTGRRLGDAGPVLRLVSPNTDALWSAYHEIRRTVLFEARGRPNAYDANHPDELKANNFPKLLLLDGIPIGTIRIDVECDVARFRRVAITTDFQRRGHGSRLLGLAETFSLKRGAVRVEASVAPDAVGFYLKQGYQALRVLDDRGSVRMAKPLVGARYT